jgi:hypothetical protein
MRQPHHPRRALLSIFLACSALSALPGEAAAPLLNVSSNGRYLATPSNDPFFIVGDTAWSLALSLTETEALQYMQTRAGQGFNTIFMDTVGLKAIVSGVSTDRNGNAPFNGVLAGGQYDVSTVPAVGDVSTTSAGRYWTHIDNLLNMAKNLGLVVVLDPFDTYCPWFSSDPANFITDGHSVNSVAKLTAYGQFLGQRYASFPNIMWVVGNDYNSNATGNTNIAAVIDGIRQFDTVHTMSLEMNPPNGDPIQAFGNATLRSRLNVNGIYLYNVGPYRANYLAGYNRSDFGPIMNLETGYELNSGIGATPATVRLGHYVMLLSGSSGDLYGNERVGGAGFGTDAGPFASDWVAQLNSQGGREMSYFATFLASIAWQTLVPDQTGTVFTGVGTPTDYSGAWATDGTLAVAYKPPTGTSAQSFVVNMSRFTGTVTARWFDPTAGTSSTIGSGLANSGSQTFNSPGVNSAGQNDWVLILSTAAIVRPQAPTSLQVQ